MTKKTMFARRAAQGLVLVVSLPIIASACSESPPVPTNEFGNPLTFDARPTSAEITEQDLMSRLYTFAADSMMGRQAGREGNMKGNAYIAAELARLGVEPAGENGTYYQELPYDIRKYTDRSSLSVNGQPLTWLTDYVPVPDDAPPLPLDGAEAIYGGVAGDTTNQLTADQANGRLVVLSPGQGGRGGGRGGRGGGRGGRGGRGGAEAPPDPLAGAVAIVTINLDGLDPADRAFINNPWANSMPDEAPEPERANIRITTAAAERLLGGPVSSLEVGAIGGTVSGALDYVVEPGGQYMRNVIGIIPGSDPALADEYVAIGAHNDHVGFTTDPLDHDSLRAYRAELMRLRIQGTDLLDADEVDADAIHINLDSIRALRPVRLDSIRNGADDDGSGSMALLELAEAFALTQTKPRRSILLVWHTSEERGLNGSRYFTDNPTVPREQIVAQINMDMIGRGRADDIPGGGDDYLAVVGSRRLSTQLGNMVAEVNQRQATPFSLDYQFDSQGDEVWGGYNNIYGRSDHANYARHDIPIAFFFTGLHADYHQFTDEPQYIDYPHYRRIASYIHDLVAEVANADQRPAVDVVQDEPIPEGGRGGRGGGG